MWLFEQRGFISVVAYDPKKDMKKDSPFPAFAKSDDTHLLVRARIKDDLDWLKEFLPTLVVDTDPSADYSYRCVVPRKVLKKALAKAVDDIDYDSHFKEVADARSPKVQGRHSAMMSCWSAMAKLQPLPPYGYSGTSGYYGSSGGYKYGGGKSTPVGSSYASSPKIGFKDVDELLADYAINGDPEQWRKGGGALHGYKPGDKVQGYFGVGEVKAVAYHDASRPDTLTVNFEKDGKVVTSNFLSTFVLPADLPEITGPDDTEGWLDLEYVYEYALNHPNVMDFPENELMRLDDDAFEFITRLQEKCDDDETKLSTDTINGVHDDLSWEIASPAEKRQMIDVGVVPEKYLGEALALMGDEENDALGKALEVLDERLGKTPTDSSS
jgi:hypothetical protein